MLHLLGAAQGSAVVWVSPPCVVWSQKSQTTSGGADLFIAWPFSQTTKHSSGHRSASQPHRSRAEQIQIDAATTSNYKQIPCHRNEFKRFLPQTDVMHQSVYELVHTEDQQELRRNLHWALNPPAVASTSSQDSPQGDSLSSLAVINQGSAFRPFTNEMKEN